MKDLWKVNVSKKSYESSEKITPIHCACLNPNPSILNHFLEIGQNFYVSDLMMRKLVHYAATNSNPEVLKLLLD